LQYREVAGIVVADGAGLPAVPAGLDFVGGVVGAGVGRAVVVEVDPVAEFVE